MTYSLQQILTVCKKYLQFAKNTYSLQKIIDVGWSNCVSMINQLQTIIIEFYCHIIFLLSTYKPYFYNPHENVCSSCIPSLLSNFKLARQMLRLNNFLYCSMIKCLLMPIQWRCKYAQNVLKVQLYWNSLCPLLYLLLSVYRTTCYFTCLIYVSSCVPRILLLNLLSR